jgi:replicative DNA helicase
MLDINPEIQLLGALLIDPSLIDTVSLKSINFQSEQHRIIFSALTEMRTNGLPIDIITVGEYLNENLDKAGGITYLSSLLDAVATTEGIEHYVDIIKRKSMANSAMIICQKVYKEIEHAKTVGLDVESAIHSGQELFSDLLNGTTETFYSSIQICNESYAHLKAMHEQGRGVSITTGIQKLNNVVGGGFYPDYIVLAARPAQGKTALAVTMMTYQLENEKCAGYVALEPTRREIINRILSQKSKINLLHFRDGKFTQDEWQRLATWHSRISEWKLLVDDVRPGVPVDDIVRRCRLLRKKGAEIIYIDQLSKIQGKGKDTYSQASHACNILSQLPKELDIPIVLISQINREFIKNSDYQPKLHHLKNTGSLEEDADMVLLLFREYEYTQEDSVKDHAQIDIAKHRHGPSGIIECGWIGKYGQFYE